MSRQRMGHKAIEELVKITEIGTSPSGKTKIWEVTSAKDGVGIAIIRWHGAWRKYVFETDPSFYDWECLRYIADFIEAQTKEHYGRK